MSKSEEQILAATGEFLGGGVALAKGWSKWVQRHFGANQWSEYVEFFQTARDGRRVGIVEIVI